jgi:hypothetical protein
MKPFITILSQRTAESLGLMTADTGADDGLLERSPLPSDSPTADAGRKPPAERSHPDAAR